MFLYGPHTGKSFTNNSGFLDLWNRKKLDGSAVRKSLICKFWLGTGKCSLNIKWYHVFYMARTLGTHFLIIPVFLTYLNNRKSLVLYAKLWIASNSFTKKIDWIWSSSDRNRNFYEWVSQCGSLLAIILLIAAIQHTRAVSGRDFINSSVYPV